MQNPFQHKHGAPPVEVPTRRALNRPFPRVTLWLCAAVLAVTSASAQDVLWRFRMETDYVPHRPAIGADGTVYVADLHARLYALRPSDGALLWSFDAGFGVTALTEGPVAVTPDGTIIVTANPGGLDTHLVAVNPDGTLRWVYTDCCSQGFIAGPNIGPDGNIYAVFDLGSGGAVSLTQEGQLRWQTTGTPVMWEYGAIGADVVFGRSTSNGPVDQFITAFDRNGDHHLWATGLDGVQKFSIVTGATNSIFGQFQGQPATAPDGTIYLSEFNSAAGWGLQTFDRANGARIWRYDPGIVSSVTPPDIGPDGIAYFSRDLTRLHAVLPDGSEKWTYLDPGVIDYGPTLSPTDDMVVLSGRLNFGQAGTVTSVAAGTGALLWRITLPDEAGGHLKPSTRALFTSDGTTIYVPIDNLGQTQGSPYSYLYAIAAGGAPNVIPPPSNLTASARSSGRRVQVTNSWKDNSATETGFEIERCTGAGCSNFQLTKRRSGRTSPATGTRMSLPPRATVTGPGRPRSPAPPSTRTSQR